MGENVPTPPPMIEFVGGPLDGQRQLVMSDIQWFQSPFIATVSADYEGPPIGWHVYKRAIGAVDMFEYMGATGPGEFRTWPQRSSDR